MEGEAHDYSSFFKDAPAPDNFTDILKDLARFVEKQVTAKRRIVLITSGGTTVPLESRTVRFIDNFSLGNRGAISAEHFLDSGYAVIFLHRRRSLEPFVRHVQHLNLLDILCLQDQQLMVKEEHRTYLTSLLQRRETVMSAGTLLLIDFTTLSDYLHYLQGVTQSLARCGRQAMLYLAAAVSDFYIPPADMAEHKIQSSDGPLQVHLEIVPKMLRPLVHDWIPEAFTVSFKLETNPDLLLAKSRQALSTYSHQVVIGNMLETRKKEVVMVTEAGEQWIRLSDEELQSHCEIEKYIVAELERRHTVHMDQ